MNNQQLRYWLLFFTIFALGIFLLGGYMHERVHQTIFAEYGIDSKIGFDFKTLNWYTLGESPCPTEACSLAHNFNEAVSYNSQQFYLLIFVGFLILYSLVGGDNGRRA
ncbi:MAG: hypothetical protein ACP5D2_03475 [Candidatus Nanoarchaeia archaeon]